MDPAKHRVITAADPEARSLFDATCERVAAYSVGFAHLRSTQTEEDAVCAGSGTLVVTGGRHAILTADHVASALPRTGEFLLLLPTAGGRRIVHRFAVDVAKIQKVTIGPASHTAEGPDLALLLLSPPDVARIEAYKVFYNLDRRQNEMLGSPRPLDYGGWFLAGAADEWTRERPAASPFSKVKTVRGSVCALVVVQGIESAEFDYLNGEAKYNAAYEGPQSFQGFSGGGLWQAVFTGSDGQLVLQDVLLSGVAFYQSALVGEIRTIYCHGRKSIYRKVIDGLATCVDRS